MKDPKEYGISSELCIAMFLSGLIAIFYSMYLGGDLSKELKKLSVQQALDVTESRHREELLYQECKNLDYEISVFTESIKEK